LPLDARSRIEIEHQGVGMLDVVDRAVPGVKLDGVDADQSEKPRSRPVLDLRDLRSVKQAPAASQ
jgi:hypothetical protein